MDLEHAANSFGEIASTRDKRGRAVSCQALCQHKGGL